MMDPCASVRETCAFVAGASRHVTIDDAKLSMYVAKLAEITHLDPPTWDEGDWHYARDADTGGPLTAQYVLVLDALNWCFWPSTSAMEYDTLATSLKRVLENDSAAFSAERLQQITAPTLRGWFEPHDLPNAEERARKLQELGVVLAANFNGSAAELVAAARGSAVALVRLLVSNFPGFRDEAVYKGRQVFLYKRAQIAVADIWAAYGRQTEGDSPYAFHDIGSLTCFPDYRLPQLLREEGVMVYDGWLSAAVNSKTELAPGSAQEVEIRAATVVVVERLRDAFNARIRADPKSDEEGKRELTAVELDWYLWQLGERAKDAIAPHHRVNTVFY